VAETPETRVPVPIEHDRQRLFYEAVALESALVSACRERRGGFDVVPPMENDTLLSNAQAFRSFVNKLAQVCDNRQGGSTVTALVVLQGHGGPEFIIGSNQREEFDLADTQDFVQRLLELVAKNPLQLKRKPLLKRVLWSILLFNIPRVEAYLDYLLRYLGECIADCVRQRLQDSESFGITFSIDFE